MCSEGAIISSPETCQHASTPRAAAPAPAIRVQNVGKCFPNAMRARDRLLHALLPARASARGFWALRDVSFDVYPGETVGIIGRNGAGKSTLLQIVCGTMALSEGRVETCGRVAALLELGAGFHPEFTGRENVFLNARIMGLSRQQTHDRFDRIAAFADIGDFIDRPVKTYSSGMYVRLAFAVAAHVDADILVIDEALAVGDAFFRQKCMRFLRTFRQRGAVLFVSHDPTAVLALCDRVLWLDDGRLRRIGPAKAVSEAYFGAVADTLNQLRRQAGDTPSADEAPLPSADEPSAAPSAFDEPPVTPLHHAVDAFGAQGAVILGVDIRDPAGREAHHAAAGQTLTLRIHFRAAQPLPQPIIGFFVNDRLGQQLFGQNTLKAGLPPTPLKPGDQRVACFTFDLPVLKPGVYTVTAAVADGSLESHTYHHWIHDAWEFAVTGPDDGAAGLVGIPMKAVTIRAPRGEAP